jgi:hypothetical protein
VVFALSSPLRYNDLVSLKLYLVACDLLYPGDYASLKEWMRTLGARQILEHGWALRSTYTAAELKDRVRGLVDTQDRVLVTEIGGEWASRRALCNLGEC